MLHIQWCFCYEPFRWLNIEGIVLIFFLLFIIVTFVYVPIDFLRHSSIPLTFINCFVKIYHMQCKSLDLIAQGFRRVLDTIKFFDSSNIDIMVPWTLFSNYTSSDFIPICHDLLGESTWMVLYVTRLLTPKP